MKPGEPVQLLVRTRRPHHRRRNRSVTAAARTRTIQPRDVTLLLFVAEMHPPSRLLRFDSQRAHSGWWMSRAAQNSFGVVLLAMSRAPGPPSLAAARPRDSVWRRASNAFEDVVLIPTLSLHVPELQGLTPQSSVEPSPLAHGGSKRQRPSIGSAALLTPTSSGAVPTPAELSPSAPPPGARCPCVSPPARHDYGSEDRRAHVEQLVAAAKRRQIGGRPDHTARATASSRAKAAVRRLNDRDAMKLHGQGAAKLVLGRAHCRVPDAVKWLRSLAGDPQEEKKRDQRRAAEYTSSQFARRRMSENESERRLLTLTSSMRNDMATFLNHLLDWAQSGSAIAGRRNESEKQLQELAAAKLHDADSDDLRESVAQEAWSFLRASSRAAGNASLTIEAYVELKSYFDVLDTDGSGSLTLDEIEAAARRIGREESSVLQSMKNVDRDSSGAIDLLEVVKVFFPQYTLAQIGRFERTHREAITKRLEPKARMDPDDVHEISQMYRDFSRMPGGCTAENLLSVMGPYMKERPEIVRSAVELFDHDHNGFLSETEFFDLLKSSYPPFCSRQAIPDEVVVAPSLTIPEHRPAMQAPKQPPGTPTVGRPPQAPSKPFSLDALADARWHVVREGIAHPTPGDVTLLMGVRDLPPVDSVKHRLVQDYQRRGGLKFMPPGIPAFVLPAAATKVFSPRRTVHERLERAVGRVYFTATGEYAPDRVRLIGASASRLVARVLPPAERAVVGARA